MKRILTAALALLLFAGVSQAQARQDSSGFHHRGGHEMMAKQLNLTADQKAQMKTIHENQRKEMEALKNNKSLSADQVQAQRKELHKKYRDQMQSLLTPEQRDQMKKWQAERKEKGNADGRHGQKGNGFAQRGQMAKELNLTQAQKDQIARMRADGRTQMQSIRNDQSLTADQKKEKIHSLMKEQHDKFKTVLTKDQLDKLQSMKKEHRAKETK